MEIHYDDIRLAKGMILHIVYWQDYTGRQR